MATREDFFSAVYEADTMFIKKAILYEGFDINERNDATNKTALHLAIYKCYVELIDFLIQNGADCNIGDKYGILPLREAIASSGLKENKEKFDKYIYIITTLLKKAVEDKNKNWRDKAAAIKVLSKKKNLSEETVCLLMELLEDSNWHIKTAAIKTLSLQEAVPRNLMACIIPLILKAQKDDSCEESWHIRAAADNALDTLKKKYPETEVPQAVSPDKEKPLLKLEEVEKDPPQSKAFFPNIFGWFSPQVQTKEEKQPIIKGVKLKKE